ncbi:hypothetical protein SAMN05444392_102429 [Seinonella peptonophila]|uniref:DUF4878 domain-containing protein n=1 Tax=Seinonella peptonophila TaxID=112248 RepID=A0A1M4VMG7_9BACL|nr:hypothetical protein [Seinonella peptonophila]SHE70045.1 hypothetical protein SAMN05444392_102429 [Seinonella peptonophila]
MNFRLVSTWIIILILMVFPLTACSDLTDPQEILFTFLDELLSGDPQLMGDALSLIDKSNSIPELQTLITNMRQLKEQNNDAGYKTETILVAENTTKPQTASISSQYLRIPDGGITVEVELQKINGDWKLETVSATNLLYKLVNPSVSLDSVPTPGAGEWQEGQIDVHAKLAELWLMEPKK